MASVKYRNDKKLTKLKQESKKLHAEVEALEDALMLHQRYKYDNDNSVRGILRKEIGGSIWQHGGSGKLHSYRNVTDLGDVEKKDGDERVNKRRQRRQKQHESSQKENEQTRIESEQVLPAQNQNDLVAKSVNVYANGKNVNWKPEADAQILNKVDFSGNKNTELNSELKIKTNLEAQPEKITALKSKVLEKASTGVIRRRHTPSKFQNDSNKIQSSSAANKDKTSLPVQAENIIKSTKLSDLATNNVEWTKNAKNDTVQNTNSPSYESVHAPKTTNEEQAKNRPPISNKMRQTNIKPSQALERSRDHEVFKILSMPSNQRSDQLSKSFTDENEVFQKTQSKGSNFSVSQSVSKIDPQVRHWLKNLGLIEEEKYLKLFSANEIDMKELPQLTALQLDEMGITAFGALNKILRGIKELKKDSQVKPSLNTNSPTALLSSHNHRTTSDYKDIRQSKINSDLHRSSNLGERLSRLNDIKPNMSLRRSRSFVDRSSALNNLYPSSEVRISVDDGDTEKIKKEQSLVLTKSVQLEPKSNTSLPAGNIKDEAPSQISEKMNSIEKGNNQLHVPKEEKIKTLRKRSNSPARRPASSPARRKTKPDEKPSESDVPSKKKCEGDQNVQKSSLSRQGSDISNNAKKNSLNRQGSAKLKNNPVLWPRAKSAQKAEKKANEGVVAAAKRFTEKQKQMNEKEEKHTKAKKVKKAQRDEMAARHEKRQQNDEEKDENEIIDRLDKEYEIERLELSELDNDISQLISVSAIDTKNKQDDIPELKPKEGRQERSRTRSSRHHARQSINKPIYIGTDLPDNLMPQVKGNQFQASRQSEVKCIESQIEALQSKALSGEMVTMDLVKGLQQRLEEIEQQIKDAKPPKMKMLKHKRMETKYPVAMSVKGKDITYEIEKEKESKLSRSPDLSRNTDPLKSIEINNDDIMFDSTDLIGEGTFSKVYHGVCMGTEVAVKQLKIPLTAHDKNYFAAEVSLLKELHHPRVVQLLGVCTSGKLPIMVLEFMARGSLYFYLHDPKCESMDHAEYYSVAHNIALGMNYLHQHKPQVLHLDLKSMNVLLDSSGRAKIADFGFSKFRHDADLRAAKVSRKKGTCSSPSWMAPELLETGEITTKADVYSFGIILWEMLTRSHPYQGCSVFQILERVRLNKRLEITSNCPAELSALIQRCWDHNTAKRPPFKDIIQQLDKLAFPPDWRALFKEAGVPNQALEDVQSARTIISLVNNTVDLENVKTMMEDIKYSNDAIRASHELTGRSCDITGQPKNSLRKSDNFDVHTSNFMVQSREPQKHLNYSLRNSKNFVSSPARQSLDKTRSSDESLLIRRSHESPFSSRSKKSDIDKNIGDFIEEDIVDDDDLRDSYDFKFDTKEHIRPDYGEYINENADEKLFKKSQNSYRDIDEEDTTAAYLNYLKTSCEILSPTINSPKSKRGLDDAQKYLFPKSEEPDLSGSVIETVANIPRSKSPQTNIKNSENIDSNGVSHDKVVVQSHDPDVRKSYDMLLKDIFKSKNEMKSDSPSKSMVKSDDSTAQSESSDNHTISSPRKEHKAVTHETKVSKSVTTPSRHEDKKNYSSPRNPHDALLKEIQNCKTVKSSVRKSQDSTKYTSSPRKPHDSELSKSSKLETTVAPANKSHDLAPGRLPDHLQKHSSVRKSHDSLMQEVKDSISKDQKYCQKHSLSKSTDFKSGNLRSVREDLEFSLKLNNSLSKKDNSDFMNKTVLESSVVEEKLIEQNEHVDKEHMPGNDVKKEISANQKPLPGNLFEEMKDLHAKLRNEKTENVEQVKSLHTKLRSSKLDNSIEEKFENNLTEKQNLTEISEKDDTDSIDDIINDLDKLSVDSLDLNDSINEVTGHVDNNIDNTSEVSKHPEIHHYANESESYQKPNQKNVPESKQDSYVESVKNGNQNAKSVPENKDMGGSKNMKNLPDLRASLNMEITHFSSFKRKQNPKLEKLQETENKGQIKRQEKVKDKKTEVQKVKVEKKTKALPEIPKKKKNMNESSGVKKALKSDNLTGQSSRESIEAWVEQKEITPDKKEKQRKISTSSLPSHPPPIVIPDVPPVPPAPPAPPTPPPIPIEISPPPLSEVPPAVDVKAETKSLSEKKGKKVTVPEAKQSTKEAKSSVSTKLSKEDDQMIKSADLREQKEVLQSTSKPHPNQLQDLSQVNKQTYTSIAEILKRAVFNRREAMGEDNYSPSPSVASSWSFVDD